MASIPEINDICLRKHPDISIEIIQGYINEMKKFNRFNNDSMTQLAEYMLFKEENSTTHWMFSMRETKHEFYDLICQFKVTTHYRALFRILLFRYDWDQEDLQYAKIKGLTDKERSKMHKYKDIMRSNIYEKLGDSILSKTLHTKNFRQYNNKQYTILPIGLIGLMIEPDYRFLSKYDEIYINEFCGGIGQLKKEKQRVSFAGAEEQEVIVATLIDKDTPKKSKKERRKELLAELMALEDEE